MPKHTRITRLYVKDLVDILRDRRTLIAMVVVPIVLYPLLMLGSIQAATIQWGKLEEQVVRIGVQNDNVRVWLNQLLIDDLSRTEQLKAETKTTNRRFEMVSPIRHHEIIVVDEEDLESLVREGKGHCAIVMDQDNPSLLSDPSESHVLRPTVIADTAEIRSASAGRRLRGTLIRYGRDLLRKRVQAAGLPNEFVRPLVVDMLDVASAEKRGGSMLGQILPLILILMTITGAIYPAIDLTAGERERGTLETLMVAPVPIMEIITGKFLVVTTVSLIGASLNLGSMGLTMHFGGFAKAFASGGDTTVPLHILPLILPFLIPLSLLFSALLLAVCSFARTFKEAQNYVTPVILVVLVPAGIAALPGTELSGVMTVMPVANMVLLTREMLLGNYDVGMMSIVLLSTCLYAATAIAIAVKIFGQEAVLFADSGSWRAQFDRKMIRPQAYPSPMLALLYVAILFPTWFYLQTWFQTRFELFAWRLTLSQTMAIVAFFALPLLLVMYYKIDLRKAFSFRRPAPRYLLGAFLMGLGTWVLAQELTILQKLMSLFGITDEWIETVKPFADEVFTLPPLLAITLLAIIPGVCEEMLFRGLLQSSLRNKIGKWSTLLAVGLIFAIFHYVIQRFVTTFCLGVLLAYVCWQSRSILPAILLHVMHNGISVLFGFPKFQETFAQLLRLPMTDDQAATHIPLHILLPAVALLIIGLLLYRKAELDEKPGQIAG